MDEAGSGRNSKRPAEVAIIKPETTIGETKPEGFLQKKLDMICCGEENFNRNQLIKYQNVVIVGMETHICVLQMTIDLIMLANTYVVADAVISRSKFNWRTGLEYMRC